MESANDPEGTEGAGEGVCGLYAEDTTIWKPWTCGSARVSQSLDGYVWLAKLSAGTPVSSGKRVNVSPHSPGTAIKSLTLKNGTRNKRTKWQWASEKLKP